MSEDFKKESKRLWNVKEGLPSTEQLQLGCMQRIADATESMAKEYNRLIEDIEWLRSQNKTLRASLDAEVNSNIALRGHITRLRNKLKILKS